MKLLVVGGAGYIGSHMAKMLTQSGYDVLILDNLSTGFRDAALYGQFIEGDLANRALLDQIFCENDVTAVLHFAALSQVGESISKPARYYHNNVTNTKNLLDAMRRYDIRNFIFSSTAAIFGEPEYTPIDEKHSQRPISPYGRSKRMVEEMLLDYDRAYGLAQ
jgi:UDP-glucose 4-epimerase